MEYFSTNNSSNHVSLYNAVMRSVALDGGVYMPHSIPSLPPALFHHLSELTLQEVAYVVATTMFGSDIPAETLNNIVKNTLTFDIPLHKIIDRLYAVELFHGPSGTFKDIGARFMAQIIKYFIQKQPTKTNLNVFVATSGDTGGAIADAFVGVDKVIVYLFHPKNSRMSISPETLSSNRNIIPISIRGNFEECQHIVNTIYSDNELNEKISLTSANSINIARLLPQIFYYFYAYAQLLNKNPQIKEFVIATPCGNLGNLTAALFAKQMGLPISKIIAAGKNEQQTWGYIEHGHLVVSNFNSKALSTNLSRINAILSNSPNLNKQIICETYTDRQIDQIQNKTIEDYDYAMDRNSAMAFDALQKNITPNEYGIFLSTSSPILTANKNNDSEKYIKNKTTESTIILPPLYPTIKKFILQKNNLY